MSNLTLDLRPRCLDEIVGLADEIKSIRTIIESGSIPRAFILQGPFGCGKTTLSAIIAHDIQGWDFAGEPAVQVLNAATVGLIDPMRALIQASHSYPMVGKYSVIVLEEAHKISKPAQEALLVEFERKGTTTIWILNTTNPEKLITGLKAGRCHVLTVRGVDAKGREELIRRAATALKFEGDLTEIIAAETEANLDSPRKIIKAFEIFASGIPAAKAVGNMEGEYAVEFHDIGFAVCFGKWDSDMIATWMGGITIRAVSVMLKELDDKFKEKVNDPDAEEQDHILDTSETTTKADSAVGLQACVAGFLKNQMLPSIKKGKMVQRNAAKVAAACDSLAILNQACALGAQAPWLAWPGTIAALYRINLKMGAK